MGAIRNIFSNIKHGFKDNLEKFQQPIDPVSHGGIDRTAHEQLYRDKNMAYSLTLKVINNAQGKYSEVESLVDKKKEFLGMLMGYVDSTEDEPTAVSTNIGDYESKISRIVEILGSLDGEVLKKNKDVTSADSIMGLVNSMKIMSDYAQAIRHIKELIQRTKTDLTAAKSKSVTTFNYTSWKAKLLTDLVIISNNLIIVDTQCKANVEYINKIKQMW